MRIPFKFIIIYFLCACGTYSFLTDLRPQSPVRTKVTISAIWPVVASGLVLRALRVYVVNNRTNEYWYN